MSSTPTSPSLPPVPAPHPENAWGLLSLEDAIAFAKAGHMDPALLVWEFSPQSYSVIPPELLAVANKNLPRLMAVLKTTPS
ncbi:MAG: hypothetical protein HC851_19320 [Acaryochloris sp. RU_4_1]|nr:hypothetical protein [Acaryochloris sp. RU_4_1]NJR57157.1 hypothetical protein [Acaryochloris sp. CRU_2_0]